MKLNPLQLQVVKHFCNGEYAHLTDHDQVRAGGDTLFEYCVNEARDCGSFKALARRLRTAELDLAALRLNFTLNEET